MAKMNLEKMSLDELKALQKDVQSAIAGFEKRKRADAKKAIEAVAKEHGMTLNEILGGSGKSGRAPAAAKYRNPRDASQTWSGRGRQPQWFKAAIAAGKKPESLEI